MIVPFHLDITVKEQERYDKRTRLEEELKPWKERLT